MYEELIKDLRNCFGTDSMFCDCDSCHYKGLVDDHDYSKCVETLGVEAADAIERLQKPQWIPATERLPEEGTAVNITWVNHSPVIYYQHIKDKPQTATGVYYRRKWYWWSTVVQDYLAEYGEWEPDKMDDAIEVTHWMPLPEPPEEDIENG